MPDINEYQKMLHAYAIGSLEHEDLVEFNKYLKTGGELDRKELGEYQNLAALLAVSLDEKKPHPRIKDAVAKRLYRMQDEIKAKHLKKLKEADEKKETPSVKKPMLPPTRLPLDENELINKETVKFRFEEEKKEKEKAAEINKEKTIEQELEESLEEILNEPAESIEIEDLSAEEDNKQPPKDYAAVEGDVFIDTASSVMQPAEEEKEKKSDGFVRVLPLSKTVSGIEGEGDLSSYAVSHELSGVYGERSNKKNIAVIFLLILLTLIFAAGAVYFYLKYQNEVEERSNTAEQFQSEISILSDKISNRDEARLLLEQPDAEIISLQPDDGQNYNAKLYISFAGNKGFIFLGGMPDPSPNQSYQLWIQIKGSYYSLGVFNPDSVYEYYPFKIPTIEDKRGALFLLSREKMQGSKLPGENIMLRGRSSAGV